MSTRVTLDDLRSFFAAEFPQADVILDAIGPRTARVRQDIQGRHLRPGGTVSGPVMMAMVDTAAYVALLAEIGLVALAVTSNLSISFLRKPAPDRPLFADAHLIKVGRTLAVATVLVTNDGAPEPLAHATVTYAIPRDQGDAAGSAR